MNSINNEYFVQSDEQRSNHKEQKRLVEAREKPWLENHLPHEYRGARISNDIIKARNWSMIALTIQIVASIAGYSFYFVRRVNKQLALIILATKT